MLIHINWMDVISLGLRLCIQDKMFVPNYFEGTTGQFLIFWSPARLFESKTPLSYNLHIMDGGS